jgi:hypothetical protein
MASYEKTSETWDLQKLVWPRICLLNKIKPELRAIQALYQLGSAMHPYDGNLSHSHPGFRY